MDRRSATRLLWPWWIRRLPVVFCLAFTVIVIPSLQVNAQAGADAFNQLSAPAQDVAISINQARARSGLPALKVQSLLNQAAQVHVDDMVAHNRYSHWGSDGSLVKDRVKRTGYSANPWVSENWVATTSASGAMRWWMNDTIHRLNILNGHWIEMGIGVGSRPGTREMIFVTVFSAGEGSQDQGEGDTVAVPVAIQAANSSSASVPPGGMNYTIKPGDTLMGIAVRYSVDWQTVAMANNFTENSLLQIGQTIRIPGITVEAKSSGTPKNDTGAVKAASVGSVAAKGAKPDPVTVPTEPYTVKSGDTLFSIASHAGVTWQELAAVNHLGEHDFLQIGQVVRVPKPHDASTPVVAQVSSTSLTQADSGSYYTVNNGDTIITIALQKQLDWQALLALNGLTDSSVLQPGQRIRVK